MATHIKSIIKNFLKAKKSETQEKLRIEKIVNRNLSGKLKKHIRLQKIYKDNLFFYSDSSSALYEFGLQKDRVLKEVQREFPKIEKTVIKIG